MANKKIPHYKVVIVGGGVTGTALAYTLHRFTNVSEVLLLEKYDWVAQINSHPLNNAQTSHDGSTETNYDLEHALKVQKSAIALRRYIDKKKDPELSKKTHRMCLAVTTEEVKTLEKRYRDLKPHYPDLSLVYRNWLREYDPALTTGRDAKAPLCALVSSQGYIVNYQKLAEHFYNDTKDNVRYEFLTPVRDIAYNGSYYVLITPESIIRADVVVFAAGPYSLFFGQKLGYGLDYAILPVAGSFYSGGDFLKSKVYRVQIEGMPFAAIHGDPDILNMHDTRFGPTTKPLPLMERHHYKTFRDFMKLPLVSSLRGIWILFKIISEKRLIWYVIKNIIYDLPIIGPAMFLREVRPIVPTIKYRDLKLRRGAGGIRPQIVNLKTGQLEMGDASMTGKNIIFNTTPSPGASVCLGNAHRDAQRVVEFLGNGHYFDEEKFQRELGQERLVA